MSEKADYKDLSAEYKEQIRILKDEVAELQTNCKAKDSALKRTTQKYENTLMDLDKVNEELKKAEAKIKEHVTGIPSTIIK